MDWGFDMALDKAAVPEQAALRQHKDREAAEFEQGQRLLLGCKPYKPCQKPYPDRSEAG